MEINIAILDDVPLFCDALESELKQIESRDTTLQFHISKYQDAASFLSRIQDDLYHILFLDIELSDDQTGIDIAKKLRAMDRYRFTKIVFISSHPDYAIDLFPVYPFSFLVKGKSLTAQLTDLIERYLAEQLEPDVALMPFKNGYIAYGEIIYLEYYGHLVTLHCKNGISHSERIEISFKSYCEKLKQHGFLQISQSFCVNESEIQSLTGSQLILKDGTRLDLTRTFQQSVLQRLKKTAEKHLQKGK